MVAICLGCCDRTGARGNLAGLHSSFVSHSTIPLPQPTFPPHGRLIIAPRARIFHGHEWVYATEIKKSFGDPQPGDVITLKDFRDRPLGTAIYNPQSQIVARRFSRRKQDLDLDFFTRRIGQAIEHRQRSRHR